MQKNITCHNFGVTRASRLESNNHNSFLIWFTGLSGSGKSTIANALELFLAKHKINTYVLDGDNVRTGLSKDLSFSPKDRKENIRRIGEVSNLMCDAGLVVLSAFVSPYRADRELVRDIVGADNFIEVFVNTPVQVCESRDVKGLYAKARAGEIKDLTGVSSPYEAPLNPSIVVDTSSTNLEDIVMQIYKVIKSKLELSN